jgi:hypothetical protein
MQLNELSCLVTERTLIYSTDLRRYVTVDFYLPKNISDPSSLSLLLINDGQDLAKMPFDEMLNGLIEAGSVRWDSRRPRPQDGIWHGAGARLQGAWRAGSGA